MMRRNGMALILVLWAMCVMTFSILGVLQLLSLNVTGATAMEKGAIAEAAAHGGVTIGSHAAFPMTGVPESWTEANGVELEVEATSELGRLHINRMLTEENREVLRQLFRSWGLRDAEADTVLDCLMDFIEPGNTRRLNGAKARQYQAAGLPLPLGRPFKSLEEMPMVLNFDLLMRVKPDWREYFTLHGEGQLDLISAPRDLIRAVCQVGDPGANGLLRRRENLDDPLTELEDARLAMGLTEPEFEAIRERITLNGTIRRIRSVAVMGGVTRRIQAVIDIDGERTLLEWRQW